jgi:hypothetical protein
LSELKFFVRGLAAAGLLAVFASNLPAVPRGFALFDSTRIAGNSIVEIIYQPSANAVWLATERGVARTTDNGASWRNFDRDETASLLSNEVASLGLRNDTLWAGTSFTRVFGNETDGFQAVPFGTGFAITGNNGASWTPFIPDQDSGAGTLAFDIAFSDSAVWAASFFGGLVRSIDQGATWTNAFADSLAYFDFITQSFINRNNRFFSVAADTFRANDTLAIWGGTAAGLNKFTYLPRRLKPADNYIFSSAFDGSRHWFGTADGLSFTPDTGKSFVSLDQALFPGAGAVSALFADGTQILAAFSDDDSLRAGAGLYRSTNGGAGWTNLNVPYAQGTGRLIRQIIKTDSGFYAAADSGGLLFSYDGDAPWKNLSPDSLAPKDSTSFLALASFNPTPDSLILLGGTRRGVITLAFNSRPDTFVSLGYVLADTNTFAGNRIEKTAVNKFKDTLTYWVLSHPVAFPEGFSVSRSTDRGVTWETKFAAIPAYSIAFRDSGLWLGVFDSLLFSGDNGQTLKSVLVRDTAAELSLIRRSVVSLFADSALVWAGTTHGLGVTSSDSGQIWKVFRTEGDEAQKVERFFFNQSVAPGLPGNFVVALGVQKTASAKGIWVGAHQTDLEGERAGVAWSLDDGATWNRVFLDTLVWNFAFWGDTVWAATSSGLFRSPDMGQSWQKVSIVDTAGGTSFSDRVEIFAVRQINSTTVWVGGSDGAAVSTDGGQSWKIFRRFVSTGAGPGTANAEVFASPVPFSPSRGLGVCRFHYRPAQNSNVTIEIFDFAMRRVKTLFRGVGRLAGVQYDVDEWDGRNEKGDVVANGTYFFRIDFGNEKQWGKLVVLK